MSAATFERRFLRAILNAPVGALSPKQITLATVGLTVGYLVWWSIGYVALLVDGQPIGPAWRVFGWLPYAPTVLTHGYAQLVWGIGVVAGVICVMTGQTGVAVVQAELLRGNPFCSLRQAGRFALGRFWVNAGLVISLGLFLAVMAVIYALFGLLVRLPWIGDWLFALVLFLPLTIVAVLLLAVTGITVKATLVGPVVIAADRDGSVFAAIVESFASVLRRPLRWGVTTIYLLLAGKLAAYVYAVVLLVAVWGMSEVMGIGDGGRVSYLLSTALSAVPSEHVIVRFWLTPLPGLPGEVPLAAAPVVAASTVTPVVVVALAILFGSVVGYALSVVTVGQTWLMAAITKDAIDRDLSSEPSYFASEVTGSGSDNDAVERDG